MGRDNRYRRQRKGHKCVCQAIPISMDGGVDLSGTLDQIAKMTAKLTQLQAQVQSLIDKKCDKQHLDDACIIQVNNDARRLKEACSNLVSTTDNFIVSRLTASDRDIAPLLAGLLHVYKDRIKSIVQEVGPAALVGGQAYSSWKIAEFFFCESREPTGLMSPSKVVLTCDDGAIELPYEALWNRHSDSDRNPIHRAWADFWARKMTEYPSGPTLFRPHCFGPTAQDVSRLFPVDSEVPRYLFRAFDRHDTSSGGSGAVVSGRWQRAGKETLGDILSLEPGEAFEMVHRHLNKSLFTNDSDDNLKSWSSSLMFVVQYAIWRAAKRHVPASEVQICVVDTHQFPPQQFVRDRWLLRAYEALLTTPTTRAATNVFNLRLNNEAYNNGEFISQGRVDIKGRSSIISLEELWNAGLGSLYPQFFDSSLLEIGWTNRVKELRSLWDHRERGLSTKDIDYALNIAHACFGGFHQGDIALLILAFKNRKAYGDPEDRKGPMPDEPVEVRRAEHWTETFTNGPFPFADSTLEGLEDFFFVTR